MAKNSPTSYIPYQNHSIVPGYSVTSSFTSANVNLDKIGAKYANYLSGLIPGAEAPNQEALIQAIATLQGVVDQERAAELAFLQEIGQLLQVNLSDTQETWAQLIRSFNLIFSTEKVFEKNINQLKKLASKNNKGKYRDITHYLQTFYLPKAINEIIPTVKAVEDLTDTLLLRIMRRAIELMFGAQDKIDNKEDSEAIQCYQEMWDALKQLSITSDLFRNLVNLFNLRDYLTTNFDELKNSNNKPPNIQAKQKNSAGFVYEELESAVLGQFANMGKISISSGDFTLTTEVISTGKTQQKADTTIIMAEGSIDTSPLVEGKQKKDGSVRLRSIERMEQLLHNIGQKKSQIIFMSDKNYVLGNHTFHSKHAGFTAEDVPLSSLGAYGGKFNIPNVEGMVEYLASAGGGMIVTDVESCMQVIEVCIGNFLFDDLQIEVPVSTTNRVHLLSLSGIYMPASVYLEATLQGLKGIGNINIDDMVEATFNPKLKEPGSSDIGAWEAFNTQRKSEKIHISFMAGFTNFMSSLFK